MSDHAEAIGNLLGYSTDEGYMKYEPVLNLYDTNNGQYNDARLSFDTKALINSWIDYHNSHIETKLRLTGVALDANVGVAIKNGVYNAISSLQLTINDANVINNDYLPPYNSFRMYLAGDKEWADTHGDLYHFSQDDGTFDNTVATNSGFKNRVEILNLIREDTGVTALTTSFTFTLRIPLKMIHPFFEALDRPLINARMQAVFKISGVNGDRFFPIVASNATLAQSLSIIGPNRWVCYRCEFHPDTAIKINSNLSKGLVVNTNYWQAKHFKSNVDMTLPNQDFTITPGIRRARRVVCMFQNESDWSSNVKCSPSLTDYRNKFTESNLEINNERVYQQNIEGDYDHYKLLQREMFSGEDQNSNGCLVPYRSFLKKTYAYYVYNISQSKHILKDPNASVQLRLIAKKTGDTSELHMFVEQEVDVTINMTTSEVMKTGD